MRGYPLSIVTSYTMLVASDRAQRGGALNGVVSYVQVCVRVRGDGMGLAAGTSQMSVLNGSSGAQRGRGLGVCLVPQPMHVQCKLVSLLCLASATNPDHVFTLGTQCSATKDNCCSSQVLTAVLRIMCRLLTLNPKLYQPATSSSPGDALRCPYTLPPHS